MANYAFLDENDVVIQVITGPEPDDLPNEIESWEKHYSNFSGLECILSERNKDLNIKLAGIGDIYNRELKAFISPKPFESWTLDVVKKQWVAPVPMPETGYWVWNEEILDWIEYKAGA